MRAAKIQNINMLMRVHYSNQLCANNVIRIKPIHFRKSEFLIIRVHFRLCLFEIPSPHVNLEITTIFPPRSNIQKRHDEYFYWCISWRIVFHIKHDHAVFYHSGMLPYLYVPMYGR
jgi:hypothetical protein